MVKMGDVLVWPVVVESGSKEQHEGVRIPFDAFDYLRDTYSINMAVPQFTFSERGKEYFEHVMWILHKYGQP